MEKEKKNRINILIDVDYIPCILVPRDFFYFQEDMISKEPIPKEKCKTLTYLQDIKDKNNLRDVLRELRKSIEEEE